MKKVIIKTRLENLEGFEESIENLDLDFSPIIWQHDRVYLPRNYKRGMNYPRLIMRTEMFSIDGDPMYKMILKRHIEDSDVDVVDETLVADYKETVNIIHQLGFTKVNEVSKKRQTAMMDEDTFVFIDDIEGIEDVFVKIEKKIGSDDKVSEVKRNLVKFFEVFNKNAFVENAYFEIDK